MLEIKYEFPLPNDEKGEGYKFTEEELEKLLNKIYDSAYRKGYADGSRDESTYTYSSTDNTVHTCSRCGKELQGSDVKYQVCTPTFEGDSEIDYWCENCYNSFIKDINTSAPAFSDVKPTIKRIDVNKLIKQNKF